MSNDSIKQILRAKQERYTLVRDQLQLELDDEVEAILDAELEGLKSEIETLEKYLEVLGND